MVKNCYVSKAFFSFFNLFGFKPKTACAHTSVHHFKAQRNHFVNQFVKIARLYADCVEGAKEMGVIYGMGAYEKGEVNGKPVMIEAYEMGRNS